MWSSLANTLLPSLLLASVSSAAPSQEESPLQMRASGSNHKASGHGIQANNKTGTASYDQSLRPQVSEKEKGSKSHTSLATQQTNPKYLPTTDPLHS